MTRQIHSTPYRINIPNMKIRRFCSKSFMVFTQMYLFHKHLLRCNDQNVKIESQYLLIFGYFPLKTEQRYFHGRPHNHMPNSQGPNPQDNQTQVVLHKNNSSTSNIKCITDCSIPPCDTARSQLRDYERAQSNYGTLIFIFPSLEWFST